MTLLILRPEPGASATATRAAELGLHAIRLPLFEVRALAWDPPDPHAFDAVMLTSANAARHAGPALGRFLDLPAYAVGAATARAAVAAGFSRVRNGEADAAALLTQIAAEGIERLLHLAGREHRAAKCPGLAIERRIVYASEPLPDPGLPAAGVALVHSPRAAARLAELVLPARRAGIALAAISEAALGAAGAGWKAAAAAPLPSDDALLSLAARMCD